MARVGKHWNRLPREVMPSPEVIKTSVDVAFRDMV